VKVMTYDASKQQQCRDARCEMGKYTAGVRVVDPLRTLLASAINIIVTSFNVVFKILLK